MKLVNKLTVVATLATFMFAGVNLTWGNIYTDNDGTLNANLVLVYGWMLMMLHLLDGKMA